MARTTAAEMIGLTLYAKKRVPLLRWPQDDSPVLGYVEAGQRIGIVYSWIAQRPGSKFWYWQFRRDNPRPGESDVFHVPHDASILDLPQLREEYQDNLEVERRRRLEWWQRAQEDVSQAVAAGGSQLVTGAFVLGGIYLIGQFFKK